MATTSLNEECSRAATLHSSNQAQIYVTITFLSIQQYSLLPNQSSLVFSFSFHLSCSSGFIESQVCYRICENTASSFTILTAAFIYLLRGIQQISYVVGVMSWTSDRKFYMSVPIQCIKNFYVLFGLN